MSERQLEQRSAAFGTYSEFDGHNPTLPEARLRQRLCRISRRAYDHSLFASRFGAVSARLDSESFLVTPEGADLRSLSTSDIVLIRAGRSQSCHEPNKYTSIHESINRFNPSIKAIIVSCPPNVMAFGVTHRGIDTRTILESYVLLRSLPLLPYDSLYGDPVDAIARTLSATVPIVIIENDCAIATEESLIAAFDRLVSDLLSA